MSPKPAAKKQNPARISLQKAAADINAILKPTPPLAFENEATEAITKDIVELLPSIKAGDGLTPETWTTLKGLGWKDETPAAAKAPAAAAAAKPATKPVAAKVAKPAKPAAAPKAHKLGRMETIGKVIAGAASRAEKDVPAMADAAYVKAGGKSNVELMTMLFSDAKGLLRGLGLLVEENGKVSIKK